ncbi:MAG TPA: AgmX/PglI C-terminal domain-containing protein, partial [Myxococcales bacterium]|nr:AgmX/PglI C-terminal domain-containing protein [Myxococcales bacterium]
PQRAPDPGTDEHLLLESDGPRGHVASEHERPTFVPGSVDVAQPAPPTGKYARANGVKLREGELPTAEPHTPQKPLGRASPRPPTAARAQAPAPAPARPVTPAKPAKAPKLAAGTGAGGRRRGKLRLYYELHWRGMRHGSVSFGLEGSKKPKPIQGSTAMGPEFPYWGFEVPTGKFTIAEPRGDAYRIFVPGTAKVERRQGGGGFQAVSAGELENDGGHLYLQLGPGAQARLTAGGMALYATVAAPPEKVKVNPLKGLPWLLIAIQVLIASGVITLFVMAPKRPDEPDFTAKGLDPVAVRLAIQPPEKKQKAKEKVQKLKEKEKEKEVVETKAEKKITKALPKQVVQAAPAETKALKQLAKLAAAGPAMGDMLAAVDKLGNGPGAKNAKSGFKLSGLVGKEPIANAGLGTFGLGGGGKGGLGTLGAEILRGRGGGGIGAMGAGGVGKGAVGGMVTHATSHSVGVPQGNIDREAVAKTINAHLQEVRGCYERALIKDPGLAGKVVLEWTIGTTGSVTAAKTKSSTLKNSAVEGCILAALKTWQFPQPRGGVVIISYPFLFNSVGF